MKLNLTKFISAAVLTAVALGATVFGFNGTAAANASCRWQYAADGNFTTSHTPVFNSICGVNLGVGDEPDFVRIRQSANGNDEDSTNNPAYTNSVSSTCNVGDKFDVHTYIHNDAMSGDNANGSGSAVAHNVALAMSAPLNKASNSFTFASTVSASNAETVSDTANLSCGSNVELKLVPKTVHVYSQQYGWNDLADSAVNGTTPIGSPVAGSGDQWGCWNYRVVVVYQVVVQQVPQVPQATAQCLQFAITASEDRKVTITQSKFTASNANFQNAVVSWGDTMNDTYTNSDTIVGQTHQYAQDNQSHTYNLSEVMSFLAQPGTSNAGQTITSGGVGTPCVATVTFQPNQPPTIVSTPAAPTQLVNTGAGSTIGIFAAVAAMSAAGYRWFLARRLSNQ